MAAVALSGKRIFITGGAGFIGTTIARRLVDDNEIVAFDNLHRDALTGTELAEHPNLTFVEGDLLDAGRGRAAPPQVRPTSSTAARSPASTPCARAPCGRCGST